MLIEAVNYKNQSARQEIHCAQKRSASTRSRANPGFQPKIVITNKYNCWLLKTNHK